ncbi:MAG: hypothetical protein AAGL24_04730 [Pseudomonadota bacterium]
MMRLFAFVLFWFAHSALVSNAIAVESRQTDTAFFDLFPSPADRLSRADLEHRIVGVLTLENVRAGIVRSRETAFFEDCILVRRLDRNRNNCPAVDYWQVDRRIDVGLLKTADPGIHKSTRPSELTPQKSIIRFDFKPGLLERIQKVENDAQKIVDQEFASIPEGGDKRMRVLRERFEAELTDKIYTRVGDVYRWCAGFSTQGPRNSTGRQYSMFVSDDKVDEFIELFHSYGKRFCASPKQSDLMQPGSREFDDLAILRSMPDGT